MKIINAKGLMRFATSGGFPDKAGFLLKRGDLNKGFQRRWFLLRGNLLFYCEKKGDKEPVGVIILEGCTIEIAECEHVDNYAFQISFPGSSTRNYILSADSQEELESWMKALASAPYDYMRLLVVELENQLQEIRSVDNAKLVQEAERETNIFTRTYSQDKATGNPHRLTHPAAPTRNNPFDNLEDLFDVSHNAQTEQEMATCSDTSDRLDGARTITDSVYDPFEDSTTCMSLCFSVVTWQMLGITNFYEMHDEMRKQIREFSASRDNLDKVEEILSETFS